MDSDGLDQIHEMDAPIVRQGFLCPFCMQDLGDLFSLQAHVQKYHQSKSNAADDALYHLKGMFDKAKQKILHIDVAAQSADAGVAAINTFVKPIRLSVTGQSRDKDKSDLNVSQHFNHLPDIQEIGVTRNLTEHFLKYRAPCINEGAVQTNSLIIRLDKLINQCPKDFSKRKAFEKETVPWVVDRDVTVCASCYVKFTITRRRHHCRLCGKVMCHSCSQYLSFVDARKLTNPAFAAYLLDEVSRTEQLETNVPIKSSSVAKVIKQAVSSESLQSVRLKSEKMLTSTISLMKRDDTEVSLASLIQQDKNEHLRICSECKNLLDTRNEKMDQMTSPPMIVILYERLCSLLRNAHKLSSSYARIADSLSRGETMYTLASASQLRRRLMNLQNEIDSVSSNIENFGPTEDGKILTPREIALQKNIRNFAVQTLQRLVMQMCVTPNEEDYNNLQGIRQSELQQRTNLERAQNASLIVQSKSNPAFTSLKLEQDERMKESASFVELNIGRSDDGWTPALTKIHHNPFADDEHMVNPLQEQALIIKSYLKQAAEDGRIEEIKILERNLLDLEAELRRLNMETPQ